MRKKSFSENKARTAIRSVLSKRKVKNRTEISYDIADTVVNTAGETRDIVAKGLVSHGVRNAIILGRIISKELSK